MSRPGPRYAFGPFQMDVGECLLTRGSEAIPLTSKAFAVLSVLLERPGHLVEKQTLLGRVWGDAFVEEAVLSVNVAAIRRALADNGHQYIETVPKHGYRFTAAVQAITTPDGEAEERDAPAIVQPAAIPAPGRHALSGAMIVAALVVLAIMTAATYLYLGRRKLVAGIPPITSLAVLPLTNLSGDANQDYFADGMTEVLITDLSKIKALKVISRTSVMQYKAANKPLPQIARELGVDGIVEGSVLRSGNRVRITAQLISAANDRHLWADSFDRDLSDVLTLQSEVARAIAQQVRVAVNGSEQEQLASARRVIPEAHELYLKGRYFWWKRGPADLEKAAGLFAQAIAIDAKYAPAYAGLADAYTIAVNNGIQPPQLFESKAKTAALKAVALDDSLAEAHIALGRVYHNFDSDWARAEAEYRRALELDPNSASAYLAYAVMLSRVGRHEEAIASDRHAQELDPLETRISSHLVLALYDARRYDDAIAAAKKNLDFNPDDRLSHAYLGMTFFQKGMLPQAIAQLEPYKADAGPFAQTLAAVYAASGRTAEARRLVADWTEQSRHSYKPPYGLAVAHLGDANDTQLFACLERAYQMRDPYVVFINVDPLWDRYRRDPRFQSLLRRMNLKP